MTNEISYRNVEYDYINGKYGFNKEWGDYDTDVLEYVRTVCFKMNRICMGQSDTRLDEPEKSDNYAIICKRNQVYILIFSLMRYEGFYISRANIHLFEKRVGMIWLYLPEILQMVLEGMNGSNSLEYVDSVYLDSLREKNTLRVNEMITKYIEKNSIPKNFVFTCFSPEIWGDGFDIFYIKSNRFSQQSVIEYNMNVDGDMIIESNSCLNNKDFYFTYQIPNIKNRPKKESYFAEKKKINNDKKNHNLYWSLVAKNERYEFCNPISFQMNDIEFDIVEKEIMKMKNIMREN